MHDKLKPALDAILAAFSSGQVPEALARSVLPLHDVPCARWSLCNRLIVFFSGSQDARGFRQWQRAGRYPCKGSKAIYILSPRFRKDWHNGEAIEILDGFVPVPVFRREDTDGRPLPDPDPTPVQLPPLYDVAQQWGLTVRWQSFQGQALGYYTPHHREIVLATHDEQVFFHELAHAAHEQIDPDLLALPLWHRETVAELTAAVLAHLYGRRPNDGGSYQYIQRYAAQDGLDVYPACLRVLGEVDRCLQKIIRTAETGPASETAGSVLATSLATPS